MSYSEQVKQLTKDVDDKRVMASLAKRVADRSEVIKETSWMEQYYTPLPLKVRCLAVNFGYTEETIPRCPECNKPVGYDKEYQSSFNMFCSEKCSKTYRTKNALRLDKDWLYQKRITDRMSLSAIGELLNVSEFTIIKECRRLGIPAIRLNESEALVQQKLLDVELMNELHVIQHKNFKEIAKIVGTSQATVSVYFKKNLVKVNKKNSYARKNARVSKEEQELADFISSLGVSIEQNNRRLLDGKEVDILIPSMNIGFEYNGVYSHIYRRNETTESRIKGRNFHLTKTKKAKEKGVRLVHIFSDDWIFRKDIVKSMVCSMLGKTSKIPARKCKVINPSKNQKNFFMFNNHIQGKDKSSICYGLEHNGEIVAMMTFCKSRFNKAYDWELSRYCSVKNHTVIGGFSKLLAAFEKDYQGSIGSYADFSRSEGAVYSSNGFSFIKQNPPSYYYVNLKKSQERLHRAAFMKAKISDKSDTRPEWLIMEEKGYNKIYDCGTILFIKDR